MSILDGIKVQKEIDELESEIEELEEEYSYREEKLGETEWALNDRNQRLKLVKAKLITG